MRTESGGDGVSGDGCGGDVQPVASGGFVGRQVRWQLHQATAAGRQLEHVGRVALGRRREQKSHLIRAGVREEFNLVHTHK